MWVIIIIALLVIFIPKHGSYLDDENEKLIYADSEDDKKETDEDTIGAHDLSKHNKKNSKKDSESEKTTKKDSESKKATKKPPKKSKSKQDDTTEDNNNPKQATQDTSSSETRTTKPSNRPDVSAIKNPIKTSGIKETDKSIKDADDIVNKVYREGTN